MIGAKERFVIRAAQNRILKSGHRLLIETIRDQPSFGRRNVAISQRGSQRGSPKQKKRPNRKSRKAKMSIRTAVLEISRPANQGQGPESLTLGIVYLKEINPPHNEKSLEWILLTTQPLTTLEDIESVINYYESRWIIEEFHKAWKSGCQV